MNSIIKKLSRVVPTYQKIADLVDAGHDIHKSIEIGDFIWVAVIVVMTALPLVHAILRKRNTK